MQDNVQQAGRVKESRHGTAELLGENTVSIINFIELDTARTQYCIPSSAKQKCKNSKRRKNKASFTKGPQPHFSLTRKSSSYLRKKPD